MECASWLFVVYTHLSLGHEIVAGDTLQVCHCRRQFSSSRNSVKYYYSFSEDKLEERMLTWTVLVNGNEELAVCFSHNFCLIGILLTLTYAFCHLIARQQNK